MADEVWTKTTQSVNAWCGEAIHWFAQSEAAVSEALLALTKVEGAAARFVCVAWWASTSRFWHALAAEGNDCGRALAASDARAGQERVYGAAGADLQCARSAGTADMPEGLGIMLAVR